jgi:hypothetical protein
MDLEHDAVERLAECQQQWSAQTKRLAEARAALDRVRVIADEIGRDGEHGGLGVIAHRLRRAIDPDAT